MMDKRIKIMLITMLICSDLKNLSEGYALCESDRVAQLYSQVYCEKTYGIAREYGARDILVPPAYKRR